MSENRPTTCSTCDKEITWLPDTYYCEYCGHKLRDTPEIVVIKRFFSDIKGFAAIPASPITPVMIDDYREQFAEVGIDVDEPIQS